MAARLDFGENPAQTPSPAKGAPEEDAQDADAAFARLVAEQERAFYLVRGGDAAALSDGELPDAPPAEGAEEDPDVAFARALQEEEAREWEARMRALAGVPEGAPAEDGGGAAFAEAAAEAGDVDVDSMTYEQLLELGEAAGHVSRGCSATALAALPRSAYSAGAHAAAAGAEQCAVCRLEYEVGDGVVTLPCAHFYHYSCVAQWLKQNKACPCCKRELPGATPARGGAAGVTPRR